MSNWAQVDLVIDHTVRALCAKPYVGHPKGCPNFNHRARCPGNAPLIERILDLDEPVWAIWNVFPIGIHMAHMAQLHPNWTQRQLACCLYWQGKARKQLRHTITEFMREHASAFVLDTPEACGINITATMQRIGVELEWPPMNYAHQIAIAGIRI